MLTQEQKDKIKQEVYFYNGISESTYDSDISFYSDKIAQKIENLLIRDYIPDQILYVLSELVALNIAEDNNLSIKSKAISMPIRELKTGNSDITFAINNIAIKDENNILNSYSELNNYINKMFLITEPTDE